MDEFSVRRAANGFVVSYYEDVDDYGSKQSTYIFNNADDLLTYIAEQIKTAK